MDSLWIYIVEVGVDGHVGSLKRRLSANGYTQICILDVDDTFFLATTIAPVQLFLSMAAMQQ